MNQGSKDLLRPAARCAAIAFTTLVLGLPAVAAAARDDDYTSRVARILARTPLIDGHNDLPWALRERNGGKLAAIDLHENWAGRPAPKDMAPLMTDMPRLRAGGVGGQFWSVWVPSELKGAEAVQVTLEQIDLVKRLVAAYPDDLALALTAADVRSIHRGKRIASLIGIEGGHQIDNSLATLRQMYALGARYMTLTHSRNNDWADSATDQPNHGGLTPFGKEVVKEMNRLGMLVDLSHVSEATMRDALAVSTAPVIFSHSSARGIVDHPRNVSDDVLALVARNGGVVMVNFYPGYVSAAAMRWDADRAAEQTRYSAPPFTGLYLGQPERAQAALAGWDAANPPPVVTLEEVADHIEYLRRVAGIDHIGIGSDFDGIPGGPKGLEGVDRYPALLAELLRRGWTDMDVAKLAGLNVLRVLESAEQAAKKLSAERPPSEATVPDHAGQ
ncbi:MAG: dipeptidase [Steroidobacteraceae bacterium]